MQHLLLIVDPHNVRSVRVGRNLLQLVQVRELTDAYGVHLGSATLQEPGSRYCVLRLHIGSTIGEDDDHVLDSGTSAGVTGKHTVRGQSECRLGVGTAAGSGEGQCVQYVLLVRVGIQLEIKKYCS